MSPFRVQARARTPWCRSERASDAARTVPCGSGFLVRLYAPSLDVSWTIRPRRGGFRRRRMRQGGSDLHHCGAQRQTRIREGRQVHQGNLDDRNARRGERAMARHRRTRAGDIVRAGRLSRLRGRERLRGADDRRRVRGIRGSTHPHRSIAAHIHGEAAPDHHHEVEEEETHKERGKFASANDHQTISLGSKSPKGLRDTT